MAFWVQVHEIPIRFMSKETAESICDIIGGVTRSVKAFVDEGGNFVCVRVVVDIAQQLCRGRLVSLESGEESWLLFKYERLPNLCYWCGFLNHNDKNCALWIQSKGTLPSEQKQFRLFMRAPLFVPCRKNVIYILGYYEHRP